MRVLALRCDDESDPELRRLWAEYQERDVVSTAAWEADAAFRDDLERSLFDGKTIEEISADRPLTKAERNRWSETYEACRPHTLWEAADGHAGRVTENTLMASVADQDWMVKLGSTSV